MYKYMQIRRPPRRPVDVGFACTVYAYLKPYTKPNTSLKGGRYLHKSGSVHWKYTKQLNLNHKITLETVTTLTYAFAASVSFLSNVSYFWFIKMNHKFILVIQLQMSSKKSLAQLSWHRGRTRLKRWRKLNGCRCERNISALGLIPHPDQAGRTMKSRPSDCMSFHLGFRLGNPRYSDRSRHHLLFSAYPRKGDMGGRTVVPFQ